MARKVRFPALGAVLGALAGVIGTVISDPHIIQTVAGKVGVSVTIVGVIAGAIAKPLLRED